MQLQLNEKIVSISGYNGLYSITSYGRIWSHIRFKGNRWCGNLFLKLKTDKCGYLNITLHKDNKQKSFKIHRLVAEYFILNPLDLPEVNHKDTNKYNCREDNLEWCTHEENINHAIINKLYYHRQNSAFHGIYFETKGKTEKKWRAQVYFNGKKNHIGRYLTEFEAAKGYNKFIINNRLNRPLNYLKYE